MPTINVDPKEITAQLGRWEKSCASPYLLQMWRYVLQCHEAGDEEDSQTAHSEVDAIPYISDEVVRLVPDLNEHSRVLDVGCLGGYGLYDFACRRTQRGEPVPNLFGLDKDGDSVRFGTDMATLWKPEGGVWFCQADATTIPYHPLSMDLVIARLLLPYVRINETLAEISRILKPGGIALFQIHGFRYYWRAFSRNLRHPARAFYYLRAVMAGAVFCVTRRQGKQDWLSEMAMTSSTLSRLCKNQRLHPAWAGNGVDKPQCAFRKKAATSDG